MTLLRVWGRRFGRRGVVEARLMDVRGLKSQLCFCNQSMSTLLWTKEVGRIEGGVVQLLSSDAALVGLRSRFLHNSPSAKPRKKYNYSTSDAVGYCFRSWNLERVPGPFMGCGSGLGEVESQTSAFSALKRKLSTSQSWYCAKLK